MARLVVGLVSGSREKFLVASTVIGAAVALDMEVDVYLLLGGARLFRKNVAGKAEYEEPALKDELERGVAAAHVPEPLENLKNLKADGKLRIHVCATAGAIWGGTKREDFCDIVDDIVGLAEYLTLAQEADVVQVI